MEYTNLAEVHEERVKRTDAVKQKYARVRIVNEVRFRNALDEIHDWFEIELEKLRRSSGQSQ